MYTMRQIRDAFPFPRQSPGYGEEQIGYCIGGACVQYAIEHTGLEVPGSELQFPYEWHIAEALRALNPELPAEEAREASINIANCNDNEEFDEGWAIVDEMMNFCD